MSEIVQAMQRPDSGLEIRDRMWLKITIPNAFIGTDMIDWLLAHVEGFQERRDARKYASNLLKAGFIRHTVNKITFSEQVSLQRHYKNFLNWVWPLNGVKVKQNFWLFWATLKFQWKFVGLKLEFSFFLPFPSIT